MDYQVKLELQRQNKVLRNLLKWMEAMEKKMNPAEKLLDGTDVMKLFGVSERTLAQWRKDNVIDFVKIGNVVRYSQGAINEMIKRNDGKLSKTKKWDLQRN